MPSEFQKRLTDYLKASYPLLYIRTHEEKRACNDIVQTFAEKEKVVIYEWDQLELLRKRDKKELTTITKVQGDADVRSIIQTCTKLGNQSERCVIILKDFHHHIEPAGMIRSIRNAIEPLKVKGNMIVFMSPTLKIPTEIEKDVQVLEYTLPDEKAITEALEQTQRSVQNNYKDRKIELPQEIKDAAVNAAKGLTISEVENTYTFAIVRHQTFNPEFVKTVFDEKIQNVKKTGLLTHIPADTGFENIGGLDELKGWMKERRSGYTPEAKAYGLPYPKGALLCGVPGCGKTVLAKAISKEFGYPLFQLDIGGLFNKYVGETEENFRRAISAVEAMGNCVLFIDEIEKSLNQDAVSGGGDSGTSSRSFATMLSWMSDRTSPIFMVATSNNHLRLPTELTRKGRFDELFWIDLPSQAEREDIFRVILARFKKDPNNKKYKISDLAKAAVGFTGSEIEQAIITAMYKAFNAKEKDIPHDMILEAIEETVPLSETRKAALEQMRQGAEGKLRFASKHRYSADEEVVSTGGSPKGRRIDA